ncbi:cyclophilin-like fold protein [Breznakiella homolactica]|uniref:Cyclophilin-like domain-containing protein n=1 Tax=Breznakiella homolactica TaxID=2798577 RepID=A0A7T7XJY3_9SPIR|nr:cyclophilin-like fold protein [Breznakiella homolactica]QQO07794.1 hypothetical protein JFL75_12685 [Breznakiella homolactica]
MGKLPTRILAAVLFALCFTVCSLAAGAGETGANADGEFMADITITIGGETFAAGLYDNVTARTLLAMLPLTMAMSDLNGNEKFFRLGESLPASSTEHPAVIRAGEIMLWSGNTLVLFYETFSNSYGGYVRLGMAEDTSRLRAALGRGNVTVTITAAN